jgi:hypothetical protein|tara:strand:+ start:478 stop:912 length:435 start_codon:yes stop_codon:yes gene_type:complete
MSLDPLTAAFDIGKSIISRVWPDPTDQAKQLFKLEELKQKGDLAQLNAMVVSLQGQLQINAVEAAHRSIFVAGWRPFIGWVGGVSLAYAGILEPLMRFIATVAGYEGDFPLIETASTITILMGMLGIGGMRSYDKKNKTQTDKL